MRDVNIIDFRKNVTKELESLPFRIVKRTRVLATVSESDESTEVQSLNKEVESLNKEIQENRAVIEKLKNGSANLPREKHSSQENPKSLKFDITADTDPASPTFNAEAHEAKYGDIRERLGDPRKVPLDCVRVSVAGEMNLSFHPMPKGGK